MSRAVTHWFLLVGVCLILSACLFSCGREPVGSDERRNTVAGKPNIIFVMTDDQDAASIEHMPLLREYMVERGATFSNAFVTNALCCPSRATILTGRYSHNHGIVGNEKPDGGYRKFRDSGGESSTIATRLKSAGYRTAYFGKYLNGYNVRRVPPGWDGWRAVSGSYLSDYLSENGELRYYDPALTHDTDILADKAVAYVEEASAKDPPFFTVIAPRAPHEPADPAPRHKGDFEDAPLPRPPSFDEADVSDKPEWIKRREKLTPEQISHLQKLREKRLESLQSVDEIFPRLIEALRENEALEDTYIVFTSDNGYHMGHHRLPDGKWTPYEEDIRVPLVVRGPGIPEGETVEELSLNNDLAPTFAALSGLKPSPIYDGSSLEPLLDGSPPENWRTAFLVEEAEKKVARRPKLTAVRTESSIYIEYASGEREFYDLGRDPFQLENRYESADPELLRRMKNRLEELRNCEGESCRISEGF